VAHGRLLGYYARTHKPVPAISIAPRSIAFSHCLNRRRQVTRRDESYMSTYLSTQGYHDGSASFREYLIGNRRKPKRQVCRICFNHMSPYQKSNLPFIHVHASLGGAEDDTPYKDVKTAILRPGCKCCSLMWSFYSVHQLTHLSPSHLELASTWTFLCSASDSFLYNQHALIHSTYSLRSSSDSYAD
jgi:hypothetical protein